MNLPNAYQAVVQESKILDYLLNPDHPIGAGKCEFFRSFGFRRDDWTLLAAALQAHAREFQVQKARESSYGTLFEIHGELNTPSGRKPRVCTVWQLVKGEIAPRLITAYPSR